MADLTNLREILANNPYGEYLISLINYFNDPHQRDRSPWEAVVAATTLRQRGNEWGNGSFTTSPAYASFIDHCYCPDGSYRGSCTGTDPGGVSCCGSGGNWNACEAVATVSIAVVPGNPTESLHDMLVRHAGTVGAPDPYTTPLKTFEFQISNMISDQANSWVYFQQIVDLFYENVSFIDYFTLDFYDGIYAHLYLDLIGGQFRQDYSASGIDLTTIKDGAAGNIPVKDVTRVKMDATGFTESLLVEGPYVAIRVNSTERAIIWYAIGTSYIEPVVAPIGGVVDTSYKVTLAVTQNAAQNSLNAKNQIEGFAIAGLDNPVVEGGDTVAMSNSIAGPQTPTTFTSFVGLVGFDGTWLSSYQDGTGNPGTSSLTEVFTGGVGFVNASAEEGAYFSAFTTAAEYIVWWKVNGAYVQPVVTPTVGYVQEYIEVTMAHLISSADVMSATMIAINDAIDFGTILNMDYSLIKAGTSDVLQWSNTPVGSFPTSNYDLPLFATSGWVENGGKYVTYVDGIDAGVIPSGGEATQIDFQKVTAQGLVGTWFKMFAGANDGVLFYYERPGYLIDPATLGTTYDTAFAIGVDQGCVVHPPEDGQFVYPCPTSGNTVEAIESVTTEAIVGTGLFTSSIVLCDDGTAPPCPIESLYAMSYTAIADGDWADSDGGTANYGAAYQVNEVISPAGTVYGSAFDDITYARIWNNQVVREMAALGQPTHYIKPVANGSNLSSGLWNCPPPCGGGCVEWGTSKCKCTSPCSVGGILIQASYASMTDDIPFNTPNTTFNAYTESRCPTCLF